MRIPPENSTESTDPIQDGPPPAAVITTPVAVVTAAEAIALSLNDAQRVAIIRITSGHTRADAALAAGVTRTTLYRWLNHDAAFQAAYNAWQRDVIATAQAELLAATRDAVATVVHSIRNGNDKLAWKLLQSQGVSDAPVLGPTEVAELQRRHELKRRKKDVAARRAQNKVELDDVTTIDEMGPPAVW